MVTKNINHHEIYTNACSNKQEELEVTVQQLNWWVGWLAQLSAAMEAADTWEGRGKEGEVMG